MKLILHLSIRVGEIETAAKNPSLHMDNVKLNFLNLVLHGNHNIPRFPRLVQYDDELIKTPSGLSICRKENGDVNRGISDGVFNLRFVDNPDFAVH